MRNAVRATFTVAAAFAITGCDRTSGTIASRGSVSTTPRMVISEIMANPRAVPDERGEWFELHNLESNAIDLRRLIIASKNDRPVVIDESVIVPAGGFVVLARSRDRAANGGVTAAYAYGDAVALGNGADWLALRTPGGLTTDSVGWTSAIVGASRALRDEAGRHADVLGSAWFTSATPYGQGDHGTPGRANGAVIAEASPRSSSAEGSGTPRATGAPSKDSTLILRVLDVGQGDAILIENGDSRVLVDGGPESVRFGRLLDQLGIDGSTLDAVILTHQHFDHYAGLRELFRTRRQISVRYLFENKDPYSNESLTALRDSVIARAQRGELAYRDTDDPCGTGAPQCTITLRGGARLHLLRPDPSGDGPNNRSTVMKLVAPDSTAFTMWLAGDAEQQEIAWFDSVDYDRSPGMRSTVLKGDHHGSCDGISPRYLDLVQPELVIFSLEAANDYGYVHTQTLDLLQRRGIPWYRTDQNGTVTITVPHRIGRYQVSTERGGPGARGPSDRPARSCGEDDRRGRR